jgi:hypothetical protein
MADRHNAKKSNQADEQSILNQILTLLIALQLMEPYMQPCKDVIHTRTRLSVNRRR